MALDYVHPIAAGGAAVESRLLIVLIQLTVIILAARVFAIIFRRLGQPAVVGEIAGGLVLGPSVLGKIEQIVPALNGLSATIFNPSVGPVFEVLSQLGLIFLLFLIGLEFDFKHLKTHSRAATFVSISGIALPFAMGMGLAVFLHPHIENELHARIAHNGDFLGFALFMGTAMSITAIPILGRMMMELNITRTRLGAVTITAAAIDDAIGWIILAAVSAMVSANFHLASTLKMAGWTVVFGLGLVLIGRPVLRWWVGRIMRPGSDAISINAMAVLLAIMFVCAIATNLIGIFSIFGAFLLGSVLSDLHEFREAITRKLRDFVTVFFLPIFFTYTGLRTDIGTLDSALMWLFAGLVSATAIAGKFGGCALAARLGGMSAREAGCVGVMMNTRALMELVVINVGYELGVIPKSVFCMLVIMALLTTVMTTPILLRLTRGTELAEYVERSEFIQRRRGKGGAPPPSDAPILVNE